MLRTRIEILPAYNAETSCRDIYDEIAGCEAWIVDRREGEVLVEIRGTAEPEWISAGRTKALRSAD